MDIIIRTAVCKKIPLSNLGIGDFTKIKRILSINIRRSLLRP